MSQTSLFLTALLPPPAELALQEHAIKQDIAARFDTKVALTKPFFR